jgi:uncharacterized protein
MTELFLRGPQTPGELRGRCSRFMPFDTLEAVTIVLDCLGQATPPWVRPMPREPGQSATRYMHLLYPDDEMPAITAAVHAPAASTAPARPQADSLRGELDALRAEVAALTARVAALENRPT